MFSRAFYRDFSSYVNFAEFFSPRAGNIAARPRQQFREINRADYLLSNPDKTRGRRANNFQSNPVVEALALKGSISSSAGESQLCSFVFYRGDAIKLSSSLATLVRNAQHTHTYTHTCASFFPLLPLVYTRACARPRLPGINTFPLRSIEPGSNIQFCLQSC